MEKDLKMKITIEVDPEEKKGIEKVGNSIHHQLVGNEDYISNNIILRLDVDAVRVYIFKECKNVPDIVI